MKKKIAIVLGTRPEIIKMAPIIKECERRHDSFFVIHTNQHYDKLLDKVFFNNLRLPKPKYNLKVGSGSHGKMTGKMLSLIEKVLIKEKPDVVLVQGDTNTVLAGALAAKKMNIKVGHIEAGLRSFDKRMPEETNRIIVDHISDYLFVPTQISKNNLLKEGIKKNKIFVTGNTIIDSVEMLFKKIGDEQVKNVLRKFKLEKKQYFLLTLHRQENVDLEIRLKTILNGLGKINKKIIFPIHPRTKKMLKIFKLNIPENIFVVDPIGYFDLLILQKESELVITDSGGLQEESFILKRPCITLRNNTERPETIMAGANILVSANRGNILRAVNFMLKKRIRWRSLFGRKGVAKKILSIIHE